MSQPEMSSAGGARPPRPFPWRLAFWLALLVGAGAAGVYLADRLVLAPRREAQGRIEELERRKQELERVVARLKHTERRAQVWILDQTVPSEGGPPATKLRFVEMDAEGNPVGKEREFILTGEEVYFDSLVIKFDDPHIEAGEALRGKSLLLFRRVFTNKLQPDDGHPLDARGLAPEVYAAREGPTAFERELWGNFWEYANNPKAAAGKGIRALHGDAVSIRPRKNMVYVLELRATGEVTIRPAAAKAD